VREALGEADRPATIAATRRHSNQARRQDPIIDLIINM